jgi:hypothetical protein
VVAAESGKRRKQLPPDEPPAGATPPAVTSPAATPPIVMPPRGAAGTGAGGRGAAAGRGADGRRDAAGRGAGGRGRGESPGGSISPSRGNERREAVVRDWERYSRENSPLHKPSEESGEGEFQNFGMRVRDLLELFFGLKYLKISFGNQIGGLLVIL